MYTQIKSIFIIRLKLENFNSLKLNHNKILTHCMLYLVSTTTQNIDTHEIDFIYKPRDFFCFKGISGY